MLKVVGAIALYRGLVHRFRTRDGGTTARRRYLAFDDAPERTGFSMRANNPRQRIRLGGALAIEQLRQRNVDDRLLFLVERASRHEHSRRFPQSAAPARRPERDPGRR